MSLVKKSVTALAALVTCSVLMINAANADTPGFDKRQHNQRARIAQGVRSGELTRPETRRLIKVSAT